VDDDYPYLSPRKLIAAGEALFGASWRRPLARALGVPEAEVRAVERGTHAAPEAWRVALIALAQDAALRAMQTASELLWREDWDESQAAAVESAPARLS